MKALGQGCMDMIGKKGFASALGNCTTAFQAEVPALKACAVENTDRGHMNRNICILSESQAVIKALES
jgi:hypothetical protein